jgi:hypothetical protein
MSDELNGKLHEEFFRVKLIPATMVTCRKEVGSAEAFYNPNAL